MPHLAYIGDADDRRTAPTSAREPSPPTTTGARSTARSSARTPRIGSNTVLVAPVEVGDGAYTGAGAVVNRDVPPGALAKGVPAQIEEGWAERQADEATSS